MGAYKRDVVVVPIFIGAYFSTGVLSRFYAYQYLRYTHGTCVLGALSSSLHRKRPRLSFDRSSLE